MSTVLIAAGHDVEIHESADRIFAGASGHIPARLHNGAHYPRSYKTRAACRRHTAEFMNFYGHLTRGVEVNIYAIAADHSQIDFPQYRQTLSGEFEFITIHDPEEFGLRNVEGAILTGERHILSDRAREHFESELAGRVKFGMRHGYTEDDAFDVTIDCTFCANSAAGVDRYEPCLVLLLRGPTDTAITIMDGPFPSLYPWNPAKDLCSLSSAQFTPFSKECRSYEHAAGILREMDPDDIVARGQQMIESMERFYPAIRDYEFVDTMLSVRAMPLSGADTRLVDVDRQSERLIRVRAGKIDAVVEAGQIVREMLG